MRGRSSGVALLAMFLVAAACSDSGGADDARGRDGAPSTLQEADVLVGFESTTSEYLDEHGGGPAPRCLRWVYVPDVGVHGVEVGLEFVEIVGEGRRQRPSAEMRDLLPADQVDEASRWRSASLDGAQHSDAPQVEYFAALVRAVLNAEGPPATVVDLSGEPVDGHAVDWPPVRVEGLFTSRSAAVALAPPSGMLAVVRASGTFGEDPPLREDTTIAILDDAAAVDLKLPDEGSTTSPASENLLPDDCE